MSKNLNYCVIDLGSKGAACMNGSTNSSATTNSSDILIKYSEDVKSISDVISCTTTNSSATNSSATNSINNIVNSTWSCTDRGSCAMGDGSYANWLNITGNRRD